MAERYLTRTHSVLNFKRQIEKPHQVGNGSPVDPQSNRQLFLSHSELVEIVLEALGLFNRVQVGSLNILDQCGLKYLLLIKFPNIDWKLGDTCELRCSKSSLPSN